MNRQMNLPAMQKIMTEVEQQTEKMDMKEEMMNDTLDDVMDQEEDEEKSEEILNQVRIVLPSDRGASSLTINYGAYRCWMKLA